MASQRAEPGELALARSIFWHGIMEASGQVRVFKYKSRNPRNRVRQATTLQAEALEWVNEDDFEYPFSFRRLCQLFGLRSQLVRDILNDPEQRNRLVTTMRHHVINERHVHMKATPWRSHTTPTQTENAA